MVNKIQFLENFCSFSLNSHGVAFLGSDNFLLHFKNQWNFNNSRLQWKLKEQSLEKILSEWNARAINQPTAIITKLYEKVVGKVETKLDFNETWRNYERYHSRLLNKSVYLKCRENINMQRVGPSFLSPRISLFKLCFLVLILWSSFYFYTSTKTSELINEIKFDKLTILKLQEKISEMFAQNLEPEKQDIDKKSNLKSLTDSAQVTKFEMGDGITTEARNYIKASQGHFSITT